MGRRVSVNAVDSLSDLARPYTHLDLERKGHWDRSSGRRFDRFIRRVGNRRDSYRPDSRDRPTVSGVFARTLDA